MDWSKKPVYWETDDAHYYSIVFSWDLWNFLSTIQNELDGKRIVIGGPAVEINKSWIPEWIETPFSPVPMLRRHNGMATRTTIGCIRKCGFCAVPHIEPEYKELDNWEVKPIIADNNLIAGSMRHFNKVIDKLKKLTWCDFNQGLDARLLTDKHAYRLSELQQPTIRLAFDSVKYEISFMNAFRLLRETGIPKKNIRAYVLIGYNDTPDDALYRLRLVQSLGIKPNPMRYQPINSKHRNEYVGENWTHKDLDRYMAYWQNLRFTGGVPFEEFSREKCKIPSFNSQHSLF